ncbi:MAG: diacylglycerol/lipid kinase family protein, partial [Solirubrobacterales bacterium]
LDPIPFSQAPPLRCAVAVDVIGTASATGIGEQVLDEALTQLRASGLSAHGSVTCTEDQLHRVIEEDPACRVILVGGDGTLHAALNAPVPPPELALVPTGRANNVAHAFGIPRDPATAIALAGSAPARPVDLLRVETADSVRYAVEGVSAGLQADARARYSGPNSGDLRAGTAALAGAIRRYRPYRASLSLDGVPQEPVDAAQVFFSNLPLFGFGFRVNPGADPSDGLLESIVIRARTRRQALRMLAASYRGTHVNHAAVSVQRVGEAAITEPLPLVVDGTPIGVSRASITIDSERLRLVAPWGG